MAKSAAEVAEGKQSITNIKDNFFQRTVLHFLVLWHSMEPIFSSLLMHDNLPSVL